MYMQKIKVYEYQNCSSCKKALKFLDAKKIPYERVPILDRPPTEGEVQQMIEFSGGNLRKLFNTAGQQFKEFQIAKRIDSMTKQEAIDLLSKHGKLVKRPFLLHPAFGLLGFKEDEWAKQFRNI